MKTIIAFFGIMFLWGISPVFAVICSPGYYVSGEECKECAKGYYSATSNASECKKCPGPYQETWVYDEYKPAAHDSKGDCFIKVNFYGNGGHFTKSNGTTQNDLAAAAYYVSSTQLYKTTCRLDNIKNIADPIYLCAANKSNIKIVDPKKNTVWHRDGYEFAGWAKESTTGALVENNETFTGPVVNLYATWCKSADTEDGNRTAKDGECVCKKGYVEEDGKCIKCPDHMTTAEAGANLCICEKGYGMYWQLGSGVFYCEKCNSGQTTYENGKCEPIKEFKFSDGGVWKWPDKVTPGNIEQDVINNNHP